MFESTLPTQDLLTLEKSAFLKEIEMHRIDSFSPLFSAETIPTWKDSHVTALHNSSVEPQDLILDAHPSDQTLGLSSALDALTGLTLEPGNSLTTAQDLGVLTAPQVLNEGVGLFDDQVNYTLNLASTVVAPLPPDLAGNTLSTAHFLGSLDQPQVVIDFVGTRDAIDFHRFEIGVESLFNLNLDQLTADAEVAVIRDINGDGIANATEILQTSTNDGSTPETLSAHLVPGTYYVAVFPYQGETHYRLSLSTTAIAPLVSDPGTGVPGFDPHVGYGLIDAAVAVAAAQGQPTQFADVPNLTSSTPWNNNAALNQINVPEVWNRGITGDGVVVAVLDSGVDLDHRDLVNNIWRNSDEIAGNGIDDDGNGYVDDIQGYDFVSNDSHPHDQEGHGTHVAGIIAAQRDGVDFNEINIPYEINGVAYDAEIMPVRVLGSVNNAYKTIAEQDAALANGIRYGVDNGASVINMSLGVPFWSSAWVNFPQTNAALSYANENGVVTVIAAGNEGDMGASFPSEPALRATENLAIAVGSVNSQGEFSVFSNPAGSFWGAYPYVVAPGESILSTTPDNRYTYSTGTSMATPHVTGVVALMQQANPNLTPAEIAQILT